MMKAVSKVSKLKTTTAHKESFGRDRWKAGRTNEQSAKAYGEH